MSSGSRRRRRSTSRYATAVSAAATTLVSGVSAPVVAATHDYSASVAENQSNSNRLAGEWGVAGSRANGGPSLLAQPALTSNPLLNAAFPGLNRSSQSSYAVCDFTAAQYKEAGANDWYIISEGTANCFTISGPRVVTETSALLKLYKKSASFNHQYVFLAADNERRIGDPAFVFSLIVWNCVGYCYDEGSNGYANWKTFFDFWGHYIPGSVVSWPPSGMSCRGLTAALNCTVNKYIYVSGP